MEPESESLIISEARFEAKSGVHKALSVPELLAAIFTWLPRGDLTRVARVCRFWSAIALDIIWEKIPTLRRLFGTYSPLVQVLGGGMARGRFNVWEFQDISGGGRWDVYWAYAQRVRAVEIHEDLYTAEVIHHLKDKLRTSSCGPSLLPNLRSLSISVMADDPHIVEALPIIPARLRNLRVTNWYHGGGSLAIQGLFKHLTAIPFDQLMEVEFSRRRRVLSNASLSLCRATFLQKNRSTLAHLNLSIFPLTSEDLEHIGSFPGVTKLALEQRGTSIQLSKFFEVIGSSFPSLRSIRVILDAEIEDDVAISVTKGLAPCRELQTIDLASHRWRALTEEDVRKLGRRWPGMEEFSLDQAKYHPDQVATPLGILPYFAQVWSRTLRKIAMTFDTAAPLSGFKFDKLETLGVGWSLLHQQDMDDVAEFLKAVSTRPFYIWGGKGDRWALVKDRVNAAWAA